MKVAASVVATRRERLAESIATEGFLPLGTLCGKLGISLATARRDLTHLQSKGRISRVRGGALSRQRGSAAANAPLHVAGELEAALFESDAAREFKEALCDVGRRLWRRGLVDGASGHFSARLGEYFLCTVAGIGRGSLRPETICMVDAAGTQVASRGPWKRSPEMLVDLAVYRMVPEAAAIVHAHPPHATAFALAASGPPAGLLPEFELLHGRIGRVAYRHPGSAELAALVAVAAPSHRSMLLTRHGVLCWGASIEDALLRLESTEAYCQAAAIASRLS